ncbi:MAG: signal peptidase I [Gallionellaceae bacterium]|nr:signal peptidase I [Gallionellaceae bacterium]
MKHWLQENRTLLVLLVCLGLFRSAVADWNPIPSGSMRPSLLEGDVVLVNRLAYDLKLPLTDIVLTHLGEPARGDIVTFTSPRDGTRLIKRIVGLPGDRVAMRGNRLYINGTAASYDVPETSLEPGAIPAMRLTESVAGAGWQVQFLARAGARDFGPVRVPAGHYLMLGDNRDNSADSRWFGFVPRQRLIGRAEAVLVSADILDDWLPRPERFGQRLR